MILCGLRGVAYGVNEQMLTALGRYSTYKEDVPVVPYVPAINMIPSECRRGVCSSRAYAASTRPGDGAISPCLSSTVCRHSTQAAGDAYKCKFETAHPQRGDKPPFRKNLRGVRVNNVCKCRNRNNCADVFPHVPLLLFAALDVSN